MEEYIEDLKKDFNDDEEDINTMILAGISLIIAGLCNLLITSKKAIY